MRWQHGAGTEVEKCNRKAMAANRWERGTISVGDAAGFEGVLGVLIVVVEPVTIRSVAISSHLLASLSFATRFGSAS